MPGHLAAYGQTWEALHPGWEHRLWTEATIPWPLTNQALYDDAESIVARGVWAFRADLIRYELLSRFGGVYIDCDFECRRPIDGLLGAKPWAAWAVPGRLIACGIMGAPAGHPFLSALIEGLPASCNNRGGRRLGGNALSGPRYLTPIALEHRIVVHPSEWFYPYLWWELDRQGEVFPDAYAVHHWHKRRSYRQAGPARGAGNRRGQ
jgi:inositol phosphorylceramide mannosyltransferase catalytic subunit